MSAPGNDDADRAMAEPGKHPSGNEVGGMRASADGGLADATQRSMERGDDPANGRASTGDAGGGAADPRVDLGGKDAPGSAASASAHRDRPRSDDLATPARGATAAAGNPDVDAGANKEDDGDRWRHEPVAPVDEQNLLESLGRAVADAVTGGAEDTSEKPER